MKKFFIGVVSFILTSSAFAGSETMIVKFAKNNESTSITLARVESATMSCSGKITTDYPYGYIYNGSSYNGTDTLTLSVTGPFEGDGRESCEISSNEGDDQVYFALDNIVISYIRNGKGYKCYIDGLVGTSYNSRFFNYNKLQAEYKDVEKSCSRPGYPVTNFDSYEVTPGRYLPGHINPYNQGYITINLQ